MVSVTSKPPTLGTKWEKSEMDGWMDGQTDRWIDYCLKPVRCAKPRTDNQNTFSGREAENSVIFKKRGVFGKVWRRTSEKHDKWAQHAAQRGVYGAGGITQHISQPEYFLSTLSNMNCFNPCVPLKVFEIFIALGLSERESTIQAAVNLPGANFLARSNSDFYSGRWTFNYTGMESLMWKVMESTELHTWIGPDYHSHMNLIEISNHKSVLNPEM